MKRVASQVVSGNGNVSIAAKDDLTARGADISAGQDVTLIGKNVVLDPGEDSSTMNQKDKSSQYGVTLAFSGYSVQAAQAAENAARAMESGDGKSAALYAVQAGIAAANSVGAVNALQGQGKPPVSNSATGNPGNSNGGGSIIKATVSIGGGSQQAEVHNAQSSSQGTTVNAGGSVNIIATGSGEKDAEGYFTDGDINARGAEISGKNVSLTAARDINLESAQDAASQNSKSSGSNASIGVGLSLGGTQNGFTIELAAAQNKAKADGTAVTNQNTHVTAGDTLTIASGRDTNLKGATATGDTIKADIGRDLNIESRQDTDDYHSRESSSGMQASICVPPICYGTTVSASGSVSSGKTDSTYASVVEQTGLYAGKGGFDINVEGNTDLKGAVIASTADKDKNTLTTGTLTTSDIENKAEYKSDTSTIAGSFSGGQGGTSVLQNLADSLAATAAGNAQKPTEGGAGGTTRSAIADGTIKIKDATGQQEKTGQTAEETIAALNRDTAAANECVSKIFDEQKVKDEQAFKRLMSETVQQAAPMLYNQVGSALENSTPETKALVHALVGGLISQALGGSFAAGAAAGGAASLAMETFGEALLDVDGLSDADRKALVQLAGAFVGGVAGAVAGGSPNDAAAGANVGKVATENNYLNHKQKRERAEALADCKDDQCEKEVRDEYARKWTENREDVANCSSYAECTSLAQELRAEQNAQGQRIAELQGKGPTNWTEAERLEYADLRLGDTTVNQMRSLALASAARYGVDSSLGSPEIADLIADVGIGAASGFGAATGKYSPNAGSVGNMKQYLTGDGFGAKLNESIRKTSKIYDGQSVYRVTDDVGPYLKKGDQVYLDGDHKNHLEVFDRNGKSTFVMNLDGTLNAEKTQAAKGRTLK